MGALLDTLQIEYPPNIFLTYANTELKNNPYGLNKTVEVIPELPYQSPTIKKSVDEMVGMRRRKRGRNSARKSNCNCSLSRMRKRVLSPEGLSCYECDHQYFLSILTEITNDRDFSKIEGFDTLLLFGGVCFEHGQAGLYGFSLEKEKIKLDISIVWPAQSHEDLGLGIGPFSTFFWGAVAQSLLAFLANDDRRKLKKCKLCGKYYVAKRIIENQKYCSKCSTKSKMSTKKRRLYMRNYRKNGQAKKERKRAEGYESQILKYMKNLDLTRDQAINLMEEERTM